MTGWSLVRVVVSAYCRYLQQPGSCADTRLGRQVSDIGASFNVVKYYDVKENNPDDRELIGKYYNQLDDYEKYNVARIDQIL